MRPGRRNEGDEDGSCEGHQSACVPPLPSWRRKSPDSGGRCRGRWRDSERQLNDVDREVLAGLNDFRDALRDRIPRETKYTVRQVVSVEPPPHLTPPDVRDIRESLGLSQSVFANFLGASLSTVRSWDQGQKQPSPMARRFLGLIAADPSYWSDRFRSIVRTEG